MITLPRIPRRARIAVAVGAVGILAATGTAAAISARSAPTHNFFVAADSYSAQGAVSGNVLSNDSGATAVVRHTEPSHGTLTVDADGRFHYTPDAGFKGTDTFTYTASDAVQLFQDAGPTGAPLPPIANVTGPAGTTTHISGEGFGSSLAPVPGHQHMFYGLTDRGPNADAPDGNKSEMVLDFAPEIGEFRLVDGQARLMKTITLKGPQSLGGTNYSGRPTDDTSEVIDDVDTQKVPSLIATRPSES
jgi:hypothetical protein